jgi:protein SCO1/2
MSNRLASIAMLALIGSALALPASAEIPSFERVRVLPAPQPISDAELTDQFGDTVRLSSLQGRVTFVLFGFTNCPDACPTAMARLRELYDARTLKDRDVAYVMISVDGQRDTPAAMKEFLAKYSPAFIGLTAEPAHVKPIATQFSAAFFKGHAGHDGRYDVAHSPQIFVLDTEGRLRAEMFSASIEAMTGVANALLDEAR